MTVNPLIPDARNWIDAYEGGVKARMTGERDTAMKSAGKAFMTDPKAAAGIIAPYDIAGAAAVSRYGDEQKALGRQGEFRTALASGDLSKAGQMAAGDPELHKAFAEHLADTTNTLATYAQTLKGLPIDQARERYRTEILPALHGRGYQGPEYDAWDPTPGNIEQIEAAAIGLKESLGLSHQAKVLEETRNHNRATEAAPKYLAVPAGGTLERIDPGRGGGAPAPATNAAPAGGADPLAAIDGVVEATGAHVTSGLRSPEHNAEVGGAPHSRHLTDQARDLVPPQGMTLAQLGDQVRAQVPGAKVIVENDHVHVQWGGDHHAGGGAPDTIHGSPKDATPPPSGYTYKPDGTLAFIPGGPADPSTKTSAGLKPVPAKVQSGYADNAKSMTQIDAAIAAIKANGGALGLKNKLGDDINQRLDPKGVGVRASVANIGSLLIHDRSGAAVTAAEQPRLMPFIPQVTDTAEAAIKKLQLLKEQYAASNDQIEVQFGEESGYRPFHGGGASTPTATPGALKADPQAISAAKAAIAKGAPRAAVIQRLRDNGIDPAGI